MRVNRLIQHLLSYRSAKAKLQLHLEPTRIERIINEVIFLNQGLLQEKNIKVKRDFAAALPEIKVDHDQVTQVMVNLLQNAIDISKNGDFIEINCRHQNMGGR